MAPSRASDDQLPQTFVHIAGVWPMTEERLWYSGIRDWAALRQTTLGHRPAVAALEESEEALLRGDLDFFFRALPASARCRALADFGGPYLRTVTVAATGLRMPRRPSLDDHPIKVDNPDGHPVIRRWLRDDALELV
jgi:hypothetical protein